MLIDEIIDLCDSKYSATETTSTCMDCNHKEKCSGGCKQCLEEIHYPKKYPSGKKDYDCNNLINFYVCDYSYKYASEIWYLLRKSEALKKLEKYNVLSIGCGGCPDLMAFESYIKETGGNKKVHYFGIDRNERWKPIHNAISNYKSDAIAATSFRYEDAIEYFNKTNNHKVKFANVLVLQYVISHFYNTGQIEKINEFFDNLVERIIMYRNERKPFVIIINDVNSTYRGRDFFIDLCKKLSDADLHGVYSQYYFDYRIQNDYQRYGVKHDSIRHLYGDIPEKLRKYEPWEVCSSAQLLIEVSEGDKK